MFNINGTIGHKISSIMVLFLISYCFISPVQATQVCNEIKTWECNAGACGWRTKKFCYEITKGNPTDHYLVGDWNGNGTDNIAVRRGGTILMDTNGDEAHDIAQAYGNGDSDHYLVGDWNGNGTDTIAVRRGGKILMDKNGDGKQDATQAYGNGGP